MASDKKKLTVLRDHKEAKEEEHAARVIRMFTEYPELARTAIIIMPPDESGRGMVLAPEDMDEIFAIGLLEKAKAALLFSQE